MWNQRKLSLEPVLAGWMLLAVLLLLAAPNSFLNDAARFATLPLSLCAALLLCKRVSVARAFSSRKNGQRGLALLFTGLFFLFLSVPNLLSAPLFSEAALSAVWWRFRAERLLYLLWNWIGLLPALILSVYLSMDAAFAAFLRPRTAAEPEGRVPLLRCYRPLLLLIAVCALSVLSTSQSLFTGDAPTVWYVAVGDVRSAWHTPGYALLVRLCYLLFHTHRGVTVLQTLAYLVIQNYILALFTRRGMGKRACRVYCVLSALAFVPIYFLQMMIKDVVFSLSLLAFGAGTLRVIGDAGEGTVRKRDFLWLGVSGLGACLFRHAGWLPVAATLPALALYLGIRRSPAVKRVLLCAASVAAGYVLIVPVLAYGVLGFEKNPGYILYSAPMAMIGAVAKSGEPIPPEDAAVMERVMPVEKWAACYEPYFSDSISRTYGAAGADVAKVEALGLGPDLIRLNARFLLRYPRVYLKAFFDLNSLAWEIATPADGYLRSYLSYPDTPVYALVQQAGYAEEGLSLPGRTFKQPESTEFSGFADLTNRYAEFLYGVPVLRSLLWRGGFADLLILFSAAVLVKKRRAGELIGLLPVAAVTLGMLFSMPAQEVRYIFPNLLFGLLAGGYGYFSFEKEK